MSLETLRILGTGFVLGLSVAAPIGPVNVEIIRRGLAIRPLAGLAIGLGAVSADCFYFGVATVAATQAEALLQSPIGMRVAFGIGAAMLTYLGWLSLRTALAKADSTGEFVEEAKRRRETQAGLPLAKTYAIGLAMTLTNPMTIGFWLSIAASFGARQDITPFLGFLGVGAGTLSWVVFVTLVVWLARRWVNARALKVINFLSALLIFAFAARFWLRVFTA